MKFTSTLLARWLQFSGQAAGRESVAAQDLVMPAQLMPVVRALDPIQGDPLTVAPGMARSSFCIYFTRQQPPASGQATLVIATLGRGQWYLELTHAASSDWDTFGTFASRVGLSGPLAGAFSTLGSSPGVAVKAGYWQQRGLEINFGLDGYQVILVQAATAAGQNTWSEVGLVAHKLS